MLLALNKAFLYLNCQPRIFRKVSPSVAECVCTKNYTPVYKHSWMQKNTRVHVGTAQMRLDTAARPCAPARAPPRALRPRAPRGGDQVPQEFQRRGGWEEEEAAAAGAGGEGGGERREEGEPPAGRAGRGARGPGGEERSRGAEAGDRGPGLPPRGRAAGPGG